MRWGESDCGWIPEPAESAAATPAACPVSQHCGTSRRNECELAAQAMWRPAPSTPSSPTGTSEPYGTEMLGKFGESEVDTPISSFQTLPSSHCARVTLRRPVRRRPVSYTHLRAH